MLVEAAVEVLPAGLLGVLVEAAVLVLPAGLLGVLVEATVTETAGRWRMLLCQPGWWRMPRGLRQAGTARGL